MYDRVTIEPMEIYTIILAKGLKLHQIQKCILSKMFSQRLLNVHKQKNSINTLYINSGVLIQFIVQRCLPNTLHLSQFTLAIKSFSVASNS